MIRYAIQIVDMSTLESNTAVPKMFIDVASARQHIIDMALMSKQFPFKIEESFMAKWCTNDVETYAMIAITYVKRANERVHYQIKKVEVEDASMDQDAEVNEAYIEVVQHGSADPFAVLNKKAE